MLIKHIGSAKNQIGRAFIEGMQLKEDSKYNTVGPLVQLGHQIYEAQKLAVKKLAWNRHVIKKEITIERKTRKPEKDVLQIKPQDNFCTLIIHVPQMCFMTTLFLKQLEAKKKKKKGMKVHGILYASPR